MAIDWSITAQEVADRVDLKVNATSRPLDTGDIDQIIDEEGADVRAVARQRGATEKTDLSDDAFDQLRKAVIWRAAAECADVMGWWSDRAQRLRDKANRILDDYATAKNTVNEASTTYLSPDNQNVDERTEFSEDTYWF